MPDSPLACCTESSWSPPPPNGNWGWLVALAGFLESGLIFGVICSFELMGHLSWVTSITIAILLFGSEYQLAAPSTGDCVAGGVLSGLGMFLASFTTSLTHLYLSIGLVSGFGGVLVFVPSVATFARYVKRRRVLATAVAFSGPGLSSLAFASLFQFLVDSYGWCGGLLIMAGTTFHLVACGTLLHPLALAEDLALAPAAQMSWLAKMSSLFGLASLFSRPFLSFAVAGLLMNLGYLVPFSHLVPHACEMALMNTRLPALAFHLLHSLTLWSLLTGVTLLLIPFGHTYPILMGIDICYGFLVGTVMPRKFSSLVKIVGTGQILETTGLVNLLESFGALAAPPPMLSGKVLNQDGLFICSVYMFGQSQLPLAVVHHFRPMRVVGSSDQHILWPTPLHAEPIGLEQRTGFP
uniref:Uncharacterized protein n=1 Tax=Chelonoidis abingdonii TaxID=106734 RepID=A0A8C0ISU3_CHEAB